jgi:hypothetical protein
LTFATYALIAYDLTAVVGRIILLIALIWSVAVSYWVGQALGQELNAFVLLAQNHSMDITAIGASIASLEPYLALTNILLVIVFIDAYLRANPRSLEPPATPVRPLAL